MSTEPAEQNLFLLVGNLTGKVESILQAMAVWQQGSAARDERVEALERRMNTMEGSLATREDLKEISEQVQTLSNIVAESKGGRQAIGGFSTQAAAWIGILLAGVSALIALAALVGVGANRSELNHIERPAAIEQNR